MDQFSILKFLHVLAAVIWVGAGFGLFLLSLRLRADNDRMGIMSLGRQSAALGKMLFAPASMATLVFGVLMVATDSRFAFTDLWILMGFVGIAASFVVGMGMLEPAGKKLATTMMESGLDHPDVDVQLSKIMRLNAIDLAILVVVIWAMVAKPML